MKEKMYELREGFNVHKEYLGTYTFEELKNYFKPQNDDGFDDFEVWLEKWENIEDAYDLMAFLEAEADGMAVNYSFEEIRG